MLPASVRQTHLAANITDYGNNSDLEQQTARPYTSKQRRLRLSNVELAEIQQGFTLSCCLVCTLRQARLIAVFYTPPECSPSQQTQNLHNDCVGLMLGQRRRRWPNIKPTLCQHFVFSAPP